MGDEPFAVKTGTAILNQGGSAADAATAMFFAMAATYPVAVGLGGGGICLVNDPVKGAREFDFLPRAAKAGGNYAVPGAVRGFYDLQSAFGALPWQRDVAGGEAYAASGFPISHALSARLASAQNAVRLDAALAAELLNEAGSPRPEGTVVTNPALSQTLAAVRLSGADGFYKGAVADEIIRYSASQGGAISAADLSDYRTVIAAPRLMNEGGLSVALPNAGNGAGVFAASLFANAARSSDPEGAVVAAVHQSSREFRNFRAPLRSWRCRLCGSGQERPGGNLRHDPEWRIRSRPQRRQQRRVACERAFDTGWHRRRLSDARDRARRQRPGCAGGCGSGGAEWHRRDRVHDSQTGIGSGNRQARRSAFHGRGAHGDGECDLLPERVRGAARSRRPWFGRRHQPIGVP